MSGFVLIYQRDGTPVEAATLGHMMASLKHRGPDGYQLSCHEAVALGHHHFWTTPEEVGERQPLWLEDDHFGMLFDGRLDNRDELLNVLGMYESDGQQYSDAAIVLHAYEKWAEQCFARLLGPFALAVYDRVRQRVVCARDSLGDRTLFYYLDNHVLLIASEEQALLAHRSVSHEPDETTLAYYFAVRTPSDGRTFFRMVRELLPAHTLVISTDKVQCWRYWNADPERRISYRSDAEYADHFRELLDNAVRRCLRMVGTPAVMMSGGLDSTSVAVLAARQLKATNERHRLLTVSWVFDNFPMCDERSYMAPLIKQYGFTAIQVNGDGDWPLSNPLKLDAHNPGHPNVNPYHALKERLYRCARDNQVRVLLTGVAGDELYSGAERWLLDLLVERRFIEAGSELLNASRKFGAATVFTSRSVRRVVKQFLSYVPGTRRLLAPGGQRSINGPLWLTPYARRQLPEFDDWPPSAAQARRPEQHRNVLGMYAALGAAGESSHAGRLNIEPRQPYRDRQLVEFMLSVPAHQLYKQPYQKYILRTAMADLLPARILTRVGPTSLLPFYRYGLTQGARPLMRALLNNPQAIWRRFVRSEWMETVVWQRLEQNLDGPEALLPWRGLSMELWSTIIWSAGNE
jgi:asparagine synthase (glutamine-hydrolysing)